MKKMNLCVLCIRLYVRVLLLGMIVAVGLSSLQHCDMSSSRNLFIVGLSLFTGLALPHWISANQSSVHTGMFAT